MKFDSVAWVAGISRTFPADALFQGERQDCTRKTNF